MNIEQNPFSIYDFLGYFVPGSILTYSAFYLLNLNNYSNVFDFIFSIKIGGFESYLPFIILSYALGQAQSFLSSYTIERFCIWHYSYPFRFLMNYSHDGYIDLKKHKITVIIKRILMFILLFPISFWDILIDLFFGVKYLKNRKFSVEIVNLLTIKFNSLIALISNSQTQIELTKADNFLLIYHYTLEHSKNHSAKFNNYVALYGFSRSMSFIFVLNFWIIIIYQFFIKGVIDMRICLSILTVSLFSYIFYLSYCKFLRRYSIEVIMAFLTIPIGNKSQSLDL